MIDRENLQKKISAYGLAAYDWHLYLDTHPYDKRAIRMFHDIVRKLRPLEQEYESRYGPLRAENSVSTDSWDWINEPWPWE